MVEVPKRRTRGWAGVGIKEGFLSRDLKAEKDVTVWNGGGFRRGRLNACPGSWNFVCKAPLS